MPSFVVSSARRPVKVQLPGGSADAQAARSAALLAAANRDDAAGSATAANNAAQAAGATVPAAADRTIGERLGSPTVWRLMCATSRAVFDRNGILSSIAPDSFGYDFSAATLANLGAPFNSARAPLNSDPRTPGGAGWSVANVGLLTPTPAPGPDGTNSAWRLTETTDAVTPIAHQIGDAITYVPSGICTANALLYAGTATHVQLSGGGTAFGGAGRRASFTLSGAGSVFDVSTSTLTGSAKIRALGGGLYWISCSWACPATVTSAIIYLNILPNGSSVGIRPTYLGTGRFVDVYAVWAEMGPYGTAAWVPRDQPRASISIDDIGPRWSGRQGSIIVDWQSRPGPFNLTGVTDADWLGLISWGDGTAGECMGLVLNPAHTEIQARCTIGGVAQTAASVTISPPAAGEVTRAVLSWSLETGQMQVAARGVAGTKVARTSLPRQGLIMPGSYGFTRPHNDIIAGYEPRPVALFDAAAAALA